MKPPATRAAERASTNDPLQPRRPQAHSVVPSPCTSICRIDPDSGLCEGCLRTLAEIADWGRMSDDHKMHVWDTLALRRSRDPGPSGSDD